MSDTPLDIRVREYEHPDAQLLIGEVQQEYVQRYGGPDEAPVDVSEFSSPHGHFVVGYFDDVPVAMGGWRLLPTTDPATTWASPAVELKRMYTRSDYRGRGISRQILGYLEQQACASGIEWVLLETGVRQPEAISLYRSSEYRDVPAFGHYADADLSIHLGKQLSCTHRSTSPSAGSACE
jgi:GNAT superfamily N-acetyltransferase